MEPMAAAATTAAPAVSARVCELTGMARDLPANRLGRGRQRSEELDHVVAIARASHGRKLIEDLAAVTGFGQPRIEDGHDAAVGRRADQPPRALRQERGRTRQVDEAEGLRSGSLATGLHQRL